MDVLCPSSCLDIWRLTRSYYSNPRGKLSTSTSVVVVVPDSINRKAPNYGGAGRGLVWNVSSSAAAWDPSISGSSHRVSARPSASHSSRFHGKLGNNG